MALSGQALDYTTVWAAVPEAGAQRYLSGPVGRAPTGPATPGFDYDQQRECSLSGVPGNILDRGYTVHH